MKSSPKIDIFSATNSLKVLSCLVERPGKNLYASEIAEITGISRAGVYLALKELKKQNLVSANKEGKFFSYSILYDDSAIKQFKVLKNVLALRPIVSKLKPFSRKIILYGSYGRGENDATSDIDIFINARDPDGATEAISSIKTKQKIEAVIKTSAEISEFKDSDKTYIQEVDRGIVLWEQKE